MNIIYNESYTPYHSVGIMWYIGLKTELDYKIKVQRLAIIIMLFIICNAKTREPHNISLPQAWI